MLPHILIAYMISSDLDITKYKEWASHASVTKP